MSQHHGRVFFLSAHKILIKTELVRLRELGYEVFCPRYFARSRAHQSLTTAWEHDQKSTLPPDVFRELAAIDFFERPLSRRAAALLNEHFSTVIVTSDPGWLVEVLRHFRGRIIFRTYGQVVLLSDFLFARDAMRPILERDDFWFVPHADEAIATEHAWLKERLRVVPYVPSADALHVKDTWSPQEAKDREIMVACPNLANPYYLAHYRYLKREFSAPHYRYYGVQMGRTEDPQIVGTLGPDDYFARFGRVAGFLYTYRDPTVCFLPPIEMMLAGGPVVFLSGSLLCRQMPADAPGRARDENEARHLCDRLLAGDRVFAGSIVASQRALTERFLPERVWPAFDAAFRELLGPEGTNRGRPVFAARLNPGATWVVADGSGIAFGEGGYQADGRAMRALPALADEAARLADEGDVIVAARRDELQHVYGYFSRRLSQPSRLRLYSVDAPMPPAARSVRQALPARAWRRLLRSLRRVRWAAAPYGKLVRAINADVECARVIVAADSAGARTLADRVRRPITVLPSHGAPG